MWKTVFTQLQSITVSQASVRVFSVGFKHDTTTKNRRLSPTSSSKNIKQIKGLERLRASENKKSYLLDNQTANYKTSSFDEDNLFEEEIDEEVDIYKYHHLKKLEEDDRTKYQEFLKQKIVERKYFKRKPEKVLSWSDKEHIRFLHNTDPQKWTYEALADQFKIEPQYIKAIAKAKWIPRKPKVPEQELMGSKSSLPFKEPTSEHSKTTYAKTPNLSRESRKMSFKEFCAKSGTPLKPKLAPVNPVLELDSQSASKCNHEEIILNYITGEAKNEKWANSNENVYLHRDEDCAGNVNVYHYDNHYGYQHPFGKIESEKNESPLVREGELLRRGDAFYDEDGDFLFRVPGLSGN